MNATGAFAIGVLFGLIGRGDPAALATAWPLAATGIVGSYTRRGR